MEGVKRVGFEGWGMGGGQTSPLCASKCNDGQLRESHRNSNTRASQLDVANYPVGQCPPPPTHVSARNTQMHECLCITVHVCVTPSCPLWLSFPHYVKHAKLIELMTSLPTVHRSSLLLSCHPLFFFFLLFFLLLKKKVELGTKRVRPQYIKDINPRSGLCSIK